MTGDGRHRVDENGYCADCELVINEPTAIAHGQRPPDRVFIDEIVAANIMEDGTPREYRLPDPITYDDLRFTWEPEIARDPTRSYSRWVNWGAEGQIRFVATEPTRFTMEQQEPRGYGRIEMRVDTESLRRELDRMRVSFSQVTEEQADALNELLSEPRYANEVLEVDPGLPAPPEDYTDRARTLAWAREVNRRGAEDEVLASERREAYFRAERSDQEMNDWEIAQAREATARAERGEKIPETPVTFSWLDGPAKKQ